MTKPIYRFWGAKTPPKDSRQIFNVVSPKTSDESTTATIRLYGPIDSWGGWWGVSSKEMAQALDALGDHITDIVLRINSPGGEVFEGLAILNLLRAHGAKVTAVVDGLAASAASLIATGVEETVMSPGTQLMIHDAWTYTAGNAAELRKEALVLDSISGSAAEVYAEAGGGTAEQWRALMVEETWYSASEAVNSGLADRVGVVADAGATETAGTPAPDPSEIEDLFDLEIFTYAGRSHAPAPPTRSRQRGAYRPPAASAGGSHPSNPEGAKLVDLTDEQIATLREQVGFPENADAETITAAIVEALEERADAPEPSTSPAAAPTAEAAQLPAGMTAVPTVAWDQMRANSEAGAAAAEQLRVAGREQFLNDHRDRFTPDLRQQWSDLYDTAPDRARALLPAMPVVVPTGEVGHDVASSAEGGTNDDSWFPQFAVPSTPKGA